MDTGNKYHVNDYKTKKIEIVSDTDTNHSNSNIGDKHSYDTVFKEIEEEEKEEKIMESKLDIISKSELLAEMPVPFRLAANLVFLFESDTHPIKFILKWVAVVASIFTGVILTLNFQLNGQTKFSIGSVPTPICYCIYGPMSIIKVHHFFNGNVGRSTFLKSWKKLPITSKQLATKYFSTFLVGHLIFATVGTVGLLQVSFEGRPEWFVTTFMIYKFMHIYTFTIGLILYSEFLIFIMVVESGSIACQINRMSEKTNKAISFFFESDDGGDDNINELGHTKSMMMERKIISRKDAKRIIKIFIQSLKKIAANVKRFVHILGSSLGLITIYLILIIIVNPFQFVVQSFKSGFILDIGQLVGLIMGETLWMYALYIMLTLSMKPSIEYTLFLRSLHCGDKVFILSECFNGESKKFFDGLEIQRQSVIWSIFGIPVTLEMYERVIGSLVSLLIAALALILRSSG